MLARSWFDAMKSRLTRTLNRQQRRAAGRPGSANRRLRLEGLEDRCLLAIDLAPSFPVGIGPQAAPAADFGSLHGNPHDYDSTRILVRFRPEADVHGLTVLDGTIVSRELPLVAGLHEVSSPRAPTSRRPWRPIGLTLWSCMRSRTTSSTPR